MACDFYPTDFLRRQTSRRATRFYCVNNLLDACRRGDEKTRGATPALCWITEICILLEETYANVVSVYCHQRNELQIEMAKGEEKNTRCADRQLSRQAALSKSC